MAIHPYIVLCQTLSVSTNTYLLVLQNNIYENTLVYAGNNNNHILSHATSPFSFYHYGFSHYYMSVHHLYSPLLVLLNSQYSLALVCPSLLCQKISKHHDHLSPYNPTHRHSNTLLLPACLIHLSKICRSYCLDVDHIGMGYRVCV